MEDTPSIHRPRLPLFQAPPRREEPEEAVRREAEITRADVDRALNQLAQIGLYPAWMPFL